MIGKWLSRLRRAAPGLDALSLDELVAGSLPRSDRQARDTYNATGVAFIHIPKNAGSSIEQALYGAKLGHRTWDEMRALDGEQFDSWFKFAVIREPIDRFLSAFDYLSQGGRNDYDAEFARRFVIGRDVSAFAMSLPSPAMCWFHFRPQSEYVLSGDGSIMVNRLVAFDRLPDGVPGNPPIERFNVTEGNRTPQTALTAEARAKLERVYNLDFALHELAQNASEGDAFGTSIKTNS